MTWLMELIAIAVGTILGSVFGLLLLANWIIARYGFSEDESLPVKGWDVHGRYY